ncbi:MAG: hypothetical protein JOZ10_11980 [Acidobacteria bacterium]|nr:hypothetical protein [Acidobacteriota bacterium]MBV9144783.1 hypothetical protein [Acidobacteriota bacterium]MBV9435120.1 hypothetical protein [Acidobacteriota bacterium]
MKRLSLALISFGFLFLICTLNAQQIDAQFGVSGINAPSATTFNLNSTDHSPQSLSGGVYPSLAADFLIWHNLGLGGEISWKGSQGLYQQSVNFRPILYDFNAVYAQKVSRVGFALMAGIGAESIRFYEGFSQCNGFGQCTNYVSSNHFLGHVGGAIRLYMTHSVYLAPEGHFYFVHNNVEFTSAHAIRYALNIGYTFGR